MRKTRSLAIMLTVAMLLAVATSTPAKAGDELGVAILGGVIGAIIGYPPVVVIVPEPHYHVVPGPHHRHRYYQPRHGHFSDPFLHPHYNPRWRMERRYQHRYHDGYHRQRKLNRYCQPPPPSEYGWRPGDRWCTKRIWPDCRGGYLCEN